jgi:hypothetical protein
VIVTDVKDGPQLPPGVKSVVRLILAGLLTLVLRRMSCWFGAHFKVSAMLPELAEPALAENVIVTGLSDHSALGEDRAA